MRVRLAVAELVNSVLKKNPKKTVQANMAEGAR